MLSHASSEHDNKISKGGDSLQYGNLLVEGKVIYKTSMQSFTGFVTALSKRVLVLETSEGLILRYASHSKDSFFRFELHPEIFNEKST